MTFFAISLIYSGVNRSFSTTSLFAFSTAATIFDISNAASVPLLLMILMLQFLPFTHEKTANGNLPQYTNIMCQSFVTGTTSCVIVNHFVRKCKDRFRPHPTINSVFTVRLYRLHKVFRHIVQIDISSIRKNNEHPSYKIRTVIPLYNL